MRELKFRAWDKFNAVFYYSDKHKNLAEFFAECQKCIDGGNELVFEQYTGLLDKNAKEIYEGDILKNPDRYFEVKIKNVECKSWVDYGYPDIHNFPCNNWCEIVGNLYENPKLLQL